MQAGGSELRIGIRHRNKLGNRSPAARYQHLASFLDVPQDVREPGAQDRYGYVLSWHVQYVH